MKYSQPKNLHLPAKSLFAFKLSYQFGSVLPNFGDHLIVVSNIGGLKNDANIFWKRDYSKDKLWNELNQIDWNIEEENVQQFWNCLESKLVSVVDKTLLN